MTKDELTKVRDALSEGCGWSDQILADYDEKYARHPATEADREFITDSQNKIIEALDILGRALAAPEPEPVAWSHPDFDFAVMGKAPINPPIEQWTPLYRHPAPQSAQPVSLETVYETIIAWDIAGKRSRRELARRMIDLFAAPPAAKEWVGLTDEELEEINDCGETDSYKFARAIEAALAALEQEPVVWMQSYHLNKFARQDCGADSMMARCSHRQLMPDYQPLYRHPAPQSHPVARVTGYYAGRCVIEPLDGKTVFSSGMAVYSAPVAAQSAQPDPWISVKDAMPKSGVIVLAYYINSHNHSRRIRAKWTAAKTEEANAEFYWGEYDEETDTYWTPEGWYECIDNWDEFSSIMVSEGEITHWMPLPLAPDDPNYTAPPSREWQDLSPLEMRVTLRNCAASTFDKLAPNWYEVRQFARAIEAALRAKNTGER